MDTKELEKNVKYLVSLEDDKFATQYKTFLTREFHGLNPGDAENRFLNLLADSLMRDNLKLSDDEFLILYKRFPSAIIRKELKPKLSQVQLQSIGEEDIQEVTMASNAAPYPVPIGEKPMMKRKWWSLEDIESQKKHSLKESKYILVDDLLK